MASLAQIEANRLNAQHSTGPRTIEGRAASSMNALKHGLDAASPILPGEDPALYQRLADGYRSDIQPTGALMEYQLDTLIDTDWQRRRLQKVRDNLYRALLAQGTEPQVVQPAVLRDSPDGKLLLRVLSRIDSLQRAHERAMNEIRRLRRERAKPAAAQEPEPADLDAQIESMIRDNGLVRVSPGNEPNSAPNPSPNKAPDRALDDAAPRK